MQICIGLLYPDLVSQALKGWALIFECFKSCLPKQA